MKMENPKPDEVKQVVMFNLLTDAITRLGKGFTTVQLMRGLNAFSDEFGTDNDYYENLVISFNVALVVSPELNN